MENNPQPLLELPADVPTIPVAEIETVPGPAGLLGHGALGEVRKGRWRPGAPGLAAAQQQQLGQQPVALKQLFFLREDPAAAAAMGGLISPEERRAVIQTFLRECRLLSHAVHPNILQFLGIVMAPSPQPHQPPQPLYMATALVPSGSLRDLCQSPRFARMRGPPAAAPGGSGPGVLSLAVVVDVLHDIFLGLEYLHGRAVPVLHRDIKPANILVEVTGGGDGDEVGGGDPLVFRKAMLADLGEANELFASTRRQTLHAQTEGVGTLVYMAPEMREAEDAKGPPLDIFSAGVLAAAIATGRPPTPGPEMVRQGGRRVAVPEEERRAADIAAVPDAALRAAIVERCVIDDPALRPTAAELVVACRRLQCGPAYLAAAAALQQHTAPAQPAAAGEMASELRRQVVAAEQRATVAERQTNEERRRRAAVEQINAELYQARDEAVAARDEAVAAQAEAVAAQDEAVAARDVALAARDEAVAACDEAVAARDEAVAARDLSIARVAALEAELAAASLAQPAAEHHATAVPTRAGAGSVGARRANVPAEARLLVSRAGSKEVNGHYKEDGQTGGRTKYTKIGNKRIEIYFARSIVGGDRGSDCGSWIVGNPLGWGVYYNDERSMAPPADGWKRGPCPAPSLVWL
eukprot:SAG31_NODE_679_length_12887_cov_3.259540_11_plen_638_part_00